MRIEFNINDMVKVKLTEVGDEIYVENRKKLSIAHEGSGLPKEDSDGYSEWQLWRLMQEFGENLGNGQPLPFETTILIERN